MKVGAIKGVPNTRSYWFRNIRFAFACGISAAGLQVLVFLSAASMSGTAVASDGTHPGYLDKLVFSLGIKGPLIPGDTSTYANVYDEMTFGSDSPLVPVTVSTFDPSTDADKYAKFGTPDPICTTNEYVIPGAYPWVSNKCDVL